MNWHIGGFVQNNNIFILIDNVQRQLTGRNLFRSLGFADVDCQMVTGAQLLAHIIVHSVYHDAFGHLFYFGQILPGKTAAAEELFHAQAVAVFVY